ncbi:hypothetical protein [Nocardia cyriacigeorgica]|uniref:hypothetical protein n=1 Tax=Nocardia cyriacigeorgica TaxID=135487 RepID=UPI0018934491|nr:hypothetical protein [Nocardia cyriacigeorgica]MBF6287676.1 hypothetical protein [Nocardia cyriacigeorgica]MBF6425364.1 hypothetical protein [Nocardia cyriacigeorgica]BDT89768.1 hypothetical protein FMUAM8_55320 [Nocardia cyriacigeorgica]BDU09155.1 hypothetical protein FMUBM48_54180 [Nocardia cyriacigeorgica]
MTSPRPNEPDVHLSVFLHGARFDYAACASAAAEFLREWSRRHTESAVILPSDATGLTRLPCERLYLEP